MKRCMLNLALCYRSHQFSRNTLNAPTEPEEVPPPSLCLVNQFMASCLPRLCAYTTPGSLVSCWNIWLAKLCVERRYISGTEDIPPLTPASWRSGIFLTGVIHPYLVSSLDQDLSSSSPSPTSPCSQSSPTSPSPSSSSAWDARCMSTSWELSRSHAKILLPR